MFVADGRVYDTYKCWYYQTIVTFLLYIHRYMIPINVGIIKLGATAGYIIKWYMIPINVGIIKLTQIN